MADSDLRTQQLKNPVKLADYLFRRLHEVGIRHVHGVPGDYNLEMLDYLPGAGLQWVGNCNELNAGYAADGYARVKGISAVITTFGVGELSAINAVAGAYSEYVPLIHIVGTPDTVSQTNGRLLHHTLGNGDYNVFANMNQQITCALVKLFDPHEAAVQIDDAIRECYIQSRPVYIAVPWDLVSKKVDGDRLKKPLDLKYKENEQEKEDYVVSVVLKYLHEAKNPVILVDGCSIRHRALDEVHALIKRTGIPTFVAPMGKGAIDESLPNYGGVYAGSGSHPTVREFVESSDLVLSIGAIKSDFNTSGFTYRISQLSTVDFHSTFVRVKYSEYPGIRMNGVLKKITEQVDLKLLSVQKGPKPDNVIAAADQMSKDPTITHAWLWPRVGQWLRENDIVIAETGTSNFGIWETRYPKNITAISQTLWGSIGYATAACQGAALAAKEKGIKRTILFTGEGSFQLTAQEVSTMIRLNLNPIIFLICNEGYTIERLIHGMDASYNDVQQWNFKDLIPVFGADPNASATYQVRTRQELEKLFQDEKFSSAPYIQFVEVHMPKTDAPRALLNMTNAK